MSNLSLAAAHDLLARLPALSSSNSAQQRVDSSGSESASEPDVEEQQRQRELLEEVQKYQEANDTLRQQLKAVSRRVERARAVEALAGGQELIQLALQVESEMDIPLKRQAAPQLQEEKVRWFRSR
jgi:histidinol-phosphate/aromatic aminotransferase/cobyric acid decarboxylase-like protein